jgi:hypothetical protein
MGRVLTTRDCIILRLYAKPVGRGFMYSLPLEFRDVSEKCCVDFELGSGYTRVLVRSKHVEFLLDEELYKYTCSWEFIGLSPILKDARNVLNLLSVISTQAGMEPGGIKPITSREMTWMASALGTNVWCKYIPIGGL